MATTVQLNTRIDPEVKRQGDAVFARAGLSSSEVVRAVWSYAAETQTVPDILAPKTAKERSDLVRSIREGAGIVRVQAESMGIRLGNAPYDFDSLHDELYNDLAGEIDGHLASS